MDKKFLSGSDCAVPTTSVFRAQDRAFGPQGAIDSMKGVEAKKHFPQTPVKRSRSVGSLVDALSTTKDLEEERMNQLRTIEARDLYRAR